MKPNILFIMTDQHHASHMGCAGHPQALTPHMDRLAAMGTRCSNAYTQNPICLPSRVSLLSGQYCQNHGFYGNHAPSPDHLPTFFRHFKEQGYRTALIGKAHLPSEPGMWGAADLDTYLDTPHYRDYIRAKGQEPDHNGHPEFDFRMINDARPSELSFEDSFEGYCVARCREFILGSKEQPFCIELSFNRPHHNLVPAQEFWDAYPDDLDMPETWKQDPSLRPPHFRNMVTHTQDELEGVFEPKENLAWQQRNWKAYLACISHSDHAVGQILDALEESGKLDNTYIIYGADHGGYHHNHGIVEKAPGICSDAVCKVPMIWAGPGLPQGSLCSALIENIDLAPSIADLAGLPEMDWVDGYSVKPLLLGEQDSLREEAVTENVRSKAIRWQNWRFVHYPRGMFGDEEAGELYDLEQDPLEERNLYFEAAFQEIVQEGRRRLLEWLIRTRRFVCHHNSGHPAHGKQARDGFARREASPDRVIEEANRDQKVWMLNYI